MTDSHSVESPITGAEGIEAVDAEAVLRRQDVAALLAGYRKENRRPRAWIGLATGIGGLALAVLFIALGDHFRWPEVFGPIFFASGWAILLTSLFVLRRRERRLLAQFQVQCPACEEPLLDGSLSRPGVSRAELAIATGNCPRCGAHILAP